LPMERWSSCSDLRRPAGFTERFGDRRAAEPASLTFCCWCDARDLDDMRP